MPTGTSKTKNLAPSIFFSYILISLARMVKWQTHRLQEAARVSAWEFKSPFGHKKKAHLF